jgi:PAS domain S-box-containing protein
MMFVSQGCLALTGYSPAQLVQNTAVTWEEITHPLDCSRVRAHIEAAVRNGQRFAVEYRINTQPGPIKWVIERGIGVRDEQGALVVEGFVEDVTAQREMAQAQ